MIVIKLGFLASAALNFNFLAQTCRPLPTVNQRDQREEEAEYDIRNLKVLWTACTFFHRFYVFHSFDSHSRFVSCL